MSDANFGQLDLNLLRVFDALIEERSVTRAGERLGLTQSAISHALNRLRFMLNDDLFVRVAEVLLSGRVDLAIGSFRRVPEPFVYEPLFQETRVWVVSADHPSARGELTLECLASLSHVIISSTGEDEQAVNGYVTEHGLERLVTRSEVGLLQGALAARGLRRVIGLTTPHFLAALAVVSQSDMAAPLPRRLAAAFADRYHLRLFDPPYTSPPFEIMALWHRNHGNEPALAWLRTVLREVAAGL